jgi:hypothetical protein
MEGKLFVVVSSRHAKKKIRLVLGGERERAESVEAHLAARLCGLLARWLITFEGFYWGKREE